MATAAAEAGGGGIGGKLKRKIPRKIPTPYDRPPPIDRAAVRGLPVEIPGPLANGNRRRGWISKIVDPASSLITRGAHRLFSSVFRKRLGAPPLADPTVQTLESGEVVEDIFVSNSEAEPGVTQEVEGQCDEDGISDLERLLKQKTFTRDEYDRLAGLLRARTVDLSNEKNNKNVGSVMPVPALEAAVQEAEKFSALERKLERSVGVTSGPSSNLKISGVELASPAEVAKAYMGSRPSKVSPSSLSLRSQIFRDATTSPSFASIQQKVTTPTHSSELAVRFPGGRAAPDNSFMTPMSRGRSAIYRMSRSPYFRPQSTIRNKEDGKVEDKDAGSWTAKKHGLLSGTQALKRRSSVLENDIGSVGPIRRIRQKSSSITPLRSLTQELPSLVSQPTNFLDSAEPSSSAQKVHPPIVGESMEGVEDRVNRADYFSVPPQSREMAKKILQQLDKLVPSPKEKGSETKTIFRDEPPSKLTVDMLHGQALKNVTEKDLSKLFNVEANGKPASKSNAYAENTGLIPSTTSIFGNKVAPEPQQTGGVIETTQVKGPLSFAGDSLQKKSAFKMQVPLEPSEYENDGNNEREVSVPSVSSAKKIDMKDQKAPVSDTFLSKKPALLGDVSVASHASEVKHERKLTSNGSIVSGKDAEFTFQVSSIPLSSQVAGKPGSPGEKDAVPIFNFGSKTSPLTFSSSLASSTEPSAAKELLPGSRPSGSTLVTEAEVEKLEQKQQPGFLFKSSSTGLPSFAFSMSTSASASQFAAQSVSTTQSNGTLSAATSFFGSSASTSVSSTSQVISASASTSATTLFSTSATTSKTEPLGPFSTPSAPLFQFAKGSSTALFASPAGIDSATKPAKESIFGVPISSTVSAPAPVKESIFGVPTSSTVSAPTPVKESIFGVPTSSTFSAPTPVKESILGAPTSSTVSAPAPVKESIFGLPASSTVSAPATVKESIFGLPASSATTPTSALTPVDSVPKPAKESIFGQPSSSTTVTMPGTIDSAPIPVKESIFGPATSPATTLPSASAESAPKPAMESIFGLSRPSATTAAPFSSMGSGLFGFSAPSASSTGTGGPSLFAQSTSQFNLAGSASTSLFKPSGAITETSLASTSAVAAPASIFRVSGLQSTAPSLFGTGFGSSTPAFGSASSSAPIFSFTQAAAAAGSATPSPSVFGFSSPAAAAFGSPMGGFKTASASPGNDQMNEDSMTDDTVAAASPAGSAPSTPLFGAAPAAFQFASPQPGSFMPGQPSFQPGTGAEFHGNFSMGSGGGGGDKTGRRFIKAKRDKHRKK
ncbi:nuclear pore complex protein [Wolffia australiana]